MFDHSEPTPLDVERKHVVDKTLERGAKVMTVARASHSSILEAFGTWRREALGQRMEAQKVSRKDLTMNSHALAVQRSPELLTRRRGRLHWEKGVSSSQARDIAHECDLRALEEYKIAHADELERDARAIREAAKARRDVVKSALPVTNRECMNWVEGHVRRLTRITSMHLLSGRTRGLRRRMHVCIECAYAYISMLAVFGCCLFRGAERTCHRVGGRL